MFCRVGGCPMGQQCSMGLEGTPWGWWCLVESAVLHGLNSVPYGHQWCSVGSATVPSPQGESLHNVSSVGGFLGVLSHLCCRNPQGGALEVKP